MLTLAVYRGDRFERRIELADRDLRVGRAHENDLVLEDPDKGVSRFHAELRADRGQYVLIDLNSQNGVWINDRRIVRETLQLDAPVTLGPYRLILEEVEDVQESEVEGESTYRTVQGSSDLARPEPNPYVPSVPGREYKPPDPPISNQVRREWSWKRIPLSARIGGAVVVGMLIVTLVVLSTRDGEKSPDQVPENSPRATSAPSTDAQTQVREHLQKAREFASLATPDGWAQALREVSSALALKPDDPEAVELRAKIEKESQTPAAPPPQAAELPAPIGPPPTPNPADPALPPSSGLWPKGLIFVGKRGNETIPQWRERGRRLNDAYVAARNAVATDRSLGIKLLEAILAEVPDYDEGNAAALLERTKREDAEAKQQASRAVIVDALKREPNDPVGAARDLQKAAMTYDSPEIRQALKGLRDRNQILGERSISECKQLYAFKEYDRALSCYERVLQLLPEGHAQRREVMDRIRDLREIR